MNKEYDSYLCRNPEHEFSGFYRSLIGKTLSEAKAILNDSRAYRDSSMVGIHHVDGVCVYVEFADDETGKKFSVGDFNKKVRAKHGQ